MISTSFLIMISSFLKTFRQINDPKILKALALATLLTLLSIVLAVTLGVALLDGILDIFSKTLQSWLGKGESWFRGFANFMGGTLILIISYFFLAGIHGAFVGIFIDDILDSIQQKHYPNMAWEEAPTFLTSLSFSLRILGLTIFLNLLASPLLILGWFIPPIGLTLQVLLNGYLMGKEYGQLVEFRIPPSASLKPTPKYFRNGIIASCIWIIPILNLVAPILLIGSVLHSRAQLLED